METMTITATPLVDALTEYARQGVIRFHMPGHRGGRACPHPLRDWLGEAMRLDATGVLGLDDLHQPGGVLQMAQELAARCFGADHTFFLVNGTSAGVHAMILATCGPGDKIVVARNLHKSALAGLILSGAHPVYVRPELDEEFGISMGVEAATVAAALEAHPGVRAVLVVNPTYYGVTSDLEAIAAVTHSHDIPLLVDEAHGPHFRFHPALPTPALEAGADAAAQGIHKILSGLTQASFLHLKGPRVDATRMGDVLRVLQSTSASYLLMASLDAARAQMVREGRALWDRALELAALLREGVAAIPGLRTFGRERAGTPGFHDLDPTKVTVQVTAVGLTGPEAEHILRYHHGIQAEMSDLYNLLFIVGYGNTREEVLHLLDALAAMARDAGGHEASGHRGPAGTLSQENRARGQVPAAPLPAPVPLPPIPPLEVLPREAFFRPARSVPLEQSRGRISAETVTCYPPGIPVLGPGEVVTPEVLEYLLTIRSTGLRISGPADPELRRLRVL
ncbi:MAG: aminotransferase class I/II-fold pyridoxal phosphate-dependent enzyme [Bacillota bacterium]